MSRSIQHRPTLNGNYGLLGGLQVYELPIPLNARVYAGATVLGTDNNYYYSDGAQWRIPTDDTLIVRPRTLTPTTGLEATQLRMTRYFSPAGLEQEGLDVEVSLTPDGFDNPLFSRTVNSPTASLYQIIYPADGLQPNDTFYWRGRYFSTLEGVTEVSDWSLVQRQNYPDFVTAPTPVNFDGMVTNSLEGSPYESVFGYTFLRSEFEILDRDTDALVTTVVNTIPTEIVELPDTLPDDTEYNWRVRYIGLEGGATEVPSEFSEIRGFSTGLSETQLTYNLDLALITPRQIGVQLNGVTSADLDWGDGTIDTVTTDGAFYHTYAAGGSNLRTLTITGQFTQLGGGLALTNEALHSVDQIGFRHGMTSMARAFQWTGNPRDLVLQSVAPDLPPAVTDLSACFRGTDVSLCNFSSWDTRYITNMNNIFSRSNIALSNGFRFWDMRACENFDGMFTESTGELEDLSNWDMASANRMTDFINLSPFNTPLPEILSPPLTNVNRAFKDSSFNNPFIWETGAVTTWTECFLNAPFDNSLSHVGLASNLALFDPLCSLSTENYSLSLIGWANTVLNNTGPYDVACEVDACLYDTTPRGTGLFTTAAAARDFLTRDRDLVVQNANDPEANGIYARTGTTLFTSGSGWTFQLVGGDWQLFNPSAQLVATGLEMVSWPWEVLTWSGVLTADQVNRYGAAWTFTGDAPA